MIRPVLLSCAWIGLFTAPSTFADEEREAAKALADRFCSARSAGDLEEAQRKCSIGRRSSSTRS